MKKSHQLVGGRSAEVGLDVVWVDVHRALSVLLRAAEVTPPSKAKIQNITKEKTRTTNRQQIINKSVFCS